MVAKNNTEDFAGRINDAWRSRQPIAPIREHFAEGDTEAAYAVQNVNTTRWGPRAAGWWGARSA